MARKKTLPPYIADLLEEAAAHAGSTILTPRPPTMYPQARVPLAGFQALDDLTEDRAEAILRALDRIAAGPSPEGLTAVQSLFTRLQSVVLSYTPSADERAAEQPAPDGFHAAETQHVHTFDLVADSVDRFLEESGLPVRPVAKKFKQTPSELYTLAKLPALSVYPGYVAVSRGEGTFLARHALRGLGGVWKPDLATPQRMKPGAWIIPAEHADEALQLVREAEQTQAEIGVTPGETKVRCFECGEAYPVSVFLSRQGAVASDWYCGCLGPTRRRQQSKS